MALLCAPIKSTRKYLRVLEKSAGMLLWLLLGNCPAFPVDNTVTQLANKINDDAIFVYVEHPLEASPMLHFLGYLPADEVVS